MILSLEALIESIKSFQPSVEIIHEDSVGKFNKYLNYFLCKLYITMMKGAPKLWGMFYKQTQKITEDSLFQRFLNSFGRGQLVAYIGIVKPNVIVCTFPTVAGILSQLRMKGELNVPVTAVVTDYTIHSQWIHRGVDAYIVGCPKVSEGFIARGIEPNRIRISGIPIMRKFERSLDRNDVLRNLGLDEDRLTFLVMCGASGVLKKAKWICKLILNTKAPIQAIVVCGNDHKLYHSLDNIVKEAHNPVVRYKFIDNVDELMSANSSSSESINKMNASFTYSKQIRERTWHNSLLRISRPLLPVIKRSFSFFFRY